MADDWDLLIHRHLEGTLEGAEHEALAERLRTDPAVRRRLAEMAFEQAQYRELLRPPVSESIPMTAVPAAPAERRSLGSVAAMAAAALFLVIVGVVTFLPRREPELIPAAPPVPRERAVEVTGKMPENFLLSDGSLVELSPGSAAILRHQAVQLDRGSGHFKVAGGEGIFRVETPAGQVTALGTEFTVDLRKSKVKSPALWVAVDSGIVRVDFRGKSWTLRAGESRFFGDPDDRKDQRPGLRARVTGEVVSRTSPEQVTLRVLKVQGDADGDALALAGKEILVVPGRSNPVKGDNPPDKQHFAFLSRLAVGKQVTLSLRHLKADVFEIVELDPDHFVPDIDPVKKIKPEKK